MYILVIEVGENALSVEAGLVGHLYAANGIRIVVELDKRLCVQKAEWLLFVYFFLQFWCKYLVCMVNMK